MPFGWGNALATHYDVIKWKHFPHYWLLVRGIHRSPVNYPHKSQWRGALMFYLILHLSKHLSKQSRRRWFEMPWRSLWRHSNGIPDNTLPQPLMHVCPTWSQCVKTYTRIFRNIEGHIFIMTSSNGNISTWLVLGELPAQMPVTRTFDIFFDVRLNKRLSKQSWGWWLDMPSCSLWRHCNVHAHLSYANSCILIAKNH